MRPPEALPTWEEGPLTGAEHTNEHPSHTGC